MGFVGKISTRSNVLPFDTPKFQRWKSLRAGSSAVVEHLWLECRRFRGHLNAWSAQSDRARRMSAHATGRELPEAVPAGVPV